MTNPRVGIVVLNWNEWEQTARCIESLQRLDYSPHDIIVVDNASSDDSVGQLRRAFPSVTLLEMERNLGFAGGCNQGIVHALAGGSDYVWLLNNDTVVAPDSLSHQITFAESLGEASLIGSTIFDLDSDDRLQTMGGAYMNKWTAKVHDRLIDTDPLDYLIGASMLVKREVFETIGMLDDWYFFYWEDADFSRRAVEAGFKIAVATDSCVYHQRSGSSGDSRIAYGRGAQADFHLMRGAVRFLHRYERRTWPIPLLSLMIKCGLLSLRRSQGISLDRLPILASGAVNGLREMSNSSSFTSIREVAESA